ncbi:hypothetical protein BLNAU_8889 [Blattamonas nauphoetae]|uniref:Uncharacterized protein n=1 Tax=Blattamonas nauphoetae TaxID=2049346 RepID=A0ABQ9XXA5_9EUKA|nr:hypothetical protein BLNAU_8889 [Blattamonas nauphoetae]
MGSSSSSVAAPAKGQTNENILKMFKVSTSDLSSEQQETILNFLRQTGQTLIHLATETNPRAFTDALTSQYRVDPSHSQTSSNSIFQSAAIKTVSEVKAVPSSSSAPATISDLLALQHRLTSHINTMFLQANLHAKSIETGEIPESIKSKSSEDGEDAGKKKHKHKKKGEKPSNLHFEVPSSSINLVSPTLIRWTSGEGKTVILNPVITSGIHRIDFVLRNTDCRSYITGCGITISPFTLDPDTVPGNDTQTALLESDGNLNRNRNHQTTESRFSDNDTLSMELNMKKRTCHFFVNSRRCQYYLSGIPGSVHFMVRSYSSTSEWEISKSVLLSKPTVKGDHGTALQW